MELLYRAYSQEAATLHRSLPTIIRGCLGKNFDLLDFHPNDCKTLSDRPFPEYNAISHFCSRLLRSPLEADARPQEMSNNSEFCPVQNASLVSKGYLTS